MKKTKTKEPKINSKKQVNKVQKKKEASIPIAPSPLGFLRASLSGYSDCLSIL